MSGITIRVYRGRVKASLFLFLTLFPLSLWSAEPDWTPYADILNEYIYQGEKQHLQANMLDYRRLKSDARFKKILYMLEQYPLETLTDTKEKMAFYINAYNILSIKMVLDNWPVRSLRSLGNMFKPVWTHDAGQLGGSIVTLRYLEHEVLRKFNDPRVHMAINCASMSCPDLRHEPYTASKLDQQLDDQTATFLQREFKGATQNSNELRVSKIFDWFEDDFDVMGGVDMFVRKYRPELPKNIEVVANLPYNWNVNCNLTGKEKNAFLAKSEW